jgi:copper transport protein
VTAALTACSWLDLAATVVIAGGFIFAAFVAPLTTAGQRVLGRASAGLGAVLVLEFAVTAFRMHAISGISGVPLILDLLDARWGRLWVVRCLGLLALAAIGRPGARMTAGAAALWPLARSFQGHAGAHGALPATVDWIHLLAAAAWLGGLVQLAIGPRPIPVETATRMRGLATTALALLIPAGVYGAFLHIPRPALLVESPYGRTLLLKLAAVTLLVALGAANHFRHVPATQRGDERAAHTLARTVRLEVAVAACVLLLTALLGVLPMPHGLP